MESTFNAAIVGLSKYIQQGKDRLTRLVQEHDAGKTKYSVQKENNLIKQIYIYIYIYIYDTRNCCPK